MAKPEKVPGTVTVYEKPTWSKCREVKRVLTEKQVPYELHDLTRDPLSAAQLKKLLKAASLSPREAVRTNEDTYKQLVAGKELSDNALLSIMAQHPELIQRPFVVRGEKVVLARPAENLKKLGIG